MTPHELLRQAALILAQGWSKDATLVMMRGA